jgi:hypothetical protein
MFNQFAAVVRKSDRKAFMVPNQGVLLIIVCNYNKPWNMKTGSHSDRQAIRPKLSSGDFLAP